MSKAAERAVRRHMREKATIDRIVKGVRKQPAARDGGTTETTGESTTATGLSVERQVRKKWGPDKGGLPTFLRGTGNG
ncbi:MAG: hypothetical protein JO032_01225 [Alphaproteobacteria bacterium]|nr:hypothetical protein [Alphaproteobacteria bacterium]